MNRLFKLLVAVLLFVSTDILAQCPPNIGFENGSLTNWQCFAGEITRLGDIQVGGLAGPIYNRHTIISKEEATIDPFGHFPTVSPNGSKYSVRLGNSDTGRMAERITYTFTVPAGQEYSLVLNYAVVLQNPAHANFEQPKFTAKVYNVTDDTYIACPSFDFIASTDLPGFQLSDVTINSKQPASVFYKDWSATTINLVGYGGKTIRLEFTTNDCSLGGHFGYAYLDLNEECTQSITGNTYCAGQTAITLRAPRGFYDYHWYNDDMTVDFGHGQNLLLDPAPPDQTKYTLVITPYPGLGCADVLHTTIYKLENPYTFKVVNTVWACEGTGADITTAAVTAGSTSGLIYNYYKNPITLEYLRNPQGVTTAGTYYIEGISPEGCSNILAVNVQFRDLPVVIVPDKVTIQYPATVNLSSIYVHDDSYNYFFYADAGATTQLVSEKVTRSGKYYIKAVNIWGCEKIVYTNVEVKPPPPYDISGPTTFTPNNDGINDYFMINVDKLVDFGDLKIYNRLGQFMYMTKFQLDYWDGKYRGQPLPMGTYYWIFEGTDQYYHAKVIRSGYVSIVR